MKKSHRYNIVSRTAEEQRMQTTRGKVLVGIDYKCLQIVGTTEAIDRL